MIGRAALLGCLWYYGTDVHGGRVSLNDRPPETYVRHLTDATEHERHRAERLPSEPKGDFKARSDFAATLIHKGETARAIAILEEIEAAHPGEYIVAVNLGTAYELSGDNDRALAWIRSGLQRNPDSHDGTEWLHVRILEAKIALAKDPAWLESHTVLGLDFGGGLVPELPWTWPEGRNAESTLRALEYQLHERLAFVKPPDPLTGGLIADLGHLAALKKSVEFAVPVYELALSYRAPQAELIGRRRDHFRSIAKPWKPGNRGAVVVLGVAGAAAAFAVLVYLVLARRRSRIV